MSRLNRNRLDNYWRCALAIALLLAVDVAQGQYERPTIHITPPATGKIPKSGAVHVDVITDKTGAVARLDFLNKVPAEVQEQIRKQTLGRRFGTPNRSYRRHIRYEVVAPPKTKAKSAS